MSDVEPPLCRARARCGGRGMSDRNLGHYVPPQTFAARLKAAMERRGVTCAAMARALGIRETTLGHYRQGRYLPRASRLAVMASVLRVHPRALVGDA